MESENKYRKFSQNAKEYLQMRYDLLRLELLEKLSLIVSLVLLIVIGIVFLLSSLMYASLAFVFYLKGIWGSAVPGFLIMCAVLLVITALLFVMKEKWFVNPLIKQLSSILFKDSDKEEVEDGK